MPWIKQIPLACPFIGYFNYINRLAEALGIEPEDFIKPWGTAGV